MSSATNKRITDSLAFRLTLSYAVLSTLSLVAVLVLSYSIVQRQLEAELDRELENEVLEYDPMLASRGMEVLRELLDHETKSEGFDRSYHRVYTRSGEVIYHSDLSPWPDISIESEAFNRAARGQQAFITLPAGDREFDTRILFSPLGPDHVIELALLADEEGAVLRDYRRVFVMSSLMFVALSVVLGSVMSKRALSGVRKVTEVARSIAGGSWRDRVPVGKRRDEVAELADAFNEMIQHIQKLLNELRDVTDDIAHDLRTPIARIRASAESCVNNPGASDETRDLAGNVLEECDRMLQLINTMLEISQMEAGVKPFASESLDLAEITEDVYDLFRPAADDKGIVMKIHSEAPLLVRGDRQRLMRAVGHVVDNAVKYTEPGGEISVSCQRLNGRAIVTVSDTGIGISDEDVSHVFDRFYRADRSRAGTGHGLGLSAARAICIAHGGTIAVHSEPGKGSRFELSVNAQ